MFLKLLLYLKNPYKQHKNKKQTKPNPSVSVWVI